MQRARRHFRGLGFLSLGLAALYGPALAQQASPAPAATAPATASPAAPAPTAPAAATALPAVPKPPDINASLHALIGMIRAQHEEGQRTELAGQLVDLMSNADATTVSNPSIDELAGLLGDGSQTVRYWAALALAQIGPQANRAVPALQKALAQAQKDKATDGPTATAASGICLAFARIGTTDPHCTNAELAATPEAAVGTGARGGKGGKKTATAPRARRGK